MWPPFAAVLDVKVESSMVGEPDVMWMAPPFSLDRPVPVMMRFESVGSDYST
jgi:hypothetical protein